MNKGQAYTEKAFSHIDHAKLFEERLQEIDEQIQAVKSKEREYPHLARSAAMTLHSLELLRNKYLAIIEDSWSQTVLRNRRPQPHTWNIVTYEDSAVGVLEVTKAQKEILAA